MGTGKKERGKTVDFISPNRFEKEVLERSALFRHAECEVIPNITPDTVSRPFDKRTVRDMYKIPEGKKLLVSEQPVICVI
jgi:hypothetical protein